MAEFVLSHPSVESVDGLTEVYHVKRGEIEP